MAKSSRVAQRQVRQQLIRSIVFALVVVGVFGLAGYHLYSAFFWPAPRLWLAM